MTTGQQAAWQARWARLTVPAGLLFAVAGLLLAAPAASAHATLLSTDPTNNAVLDDAPQAVTLTFDEPVTVWRTSVSVFDPGGERVEVDVSAVDSSVVAGLPPALEQGSYTVNWRVISADDHPVSGGFTFAIGERTTPASGIGEEDPTTSLNIARLAADSLGYLGLLAAVGLSFFELAVLDATAGAMPRLRRSMRRVARALIAMSLIAIALAVPLTIAWQQAGSLADLSDADIWIDALQSHAATSAALAAVGLLASTFFTARAARHPQPRWAIAGAAAGGLLALGSLPWVGHTRTYGPGWLVVGADLVHVGAAAIWIGCIAGLILTLSRWSDASTTRAASTVGSFSRIAAWTITALALAGTVMAWRILGSIGGLWETSYGQALIVKLAIVAVVLALAGWNRYRLVPQVMAEPRDQVARRRLGATLRFEALGLLAVLAATSVLVTQSPAASESPSTTGVVERARGIETELGDGLVRIRMSPLTVGRNYLQLYLRDADGNPLPTLGMPSVRFALDSQDLGPLPATMTRVGPGQYEGTIDLAVAGDWDVSISARTSKYESPIATMTFEIY